MKGLLIKDMSLMLGQKRFFLIVLGMGALLMFTGDNPSASMGYVTMLITIFSLNTFSYDEHENGMSFLMTLPVTRKTYVLEKYVFAGTLACGAGAFSVILAYVISTIRSIPANLVELLVVGGTLGAISIMIFAITFPLLLKFGADKGRIAMFAVFAVIGMIIALLTKFADNSNGTFEKMLVVLSDMSAGMLVLLAVFALILVLLASYLFSIKIINKKEY